MKGLQNVISRIGVADEVRLTSTASVQIWQLTTQHRYVFVDSTNAGGDLSAVYLPPVQQAKGVTICIVNKAGPDVTVYPFKSGVVLNAEFDGEPPIVEADALFVKTAGTLADSKIYDGSGAQTSQVLADAGAFTMVESNGENWIVKAFDLSI